MSGGGSKLLSIGAAGAFGIALMMMVISFAVLGAASSESAGQCSATVDPLAGATSTITTVRGSPVGFAIADEKGNIVVEHNATAPGTDRYLSHALVLLALTRTARARQLTTAERSAAVAMLAQANGRDAAANRLVRAVGLEAIVAAARAAGMSWTPRTISGSGYLLSRTPVTAADFARLMARYEALVPRRHRALAVQLLTEPAARIGALRAEIPGRVLAMADWHNDGARTWAVSQAAQFKAAGRTFGVAVVLGGQPSYEAGTEAVEAAMRAAFQALSNPAGAGTGAAPAGSYAARLPAGRPFTGADYTTEASAYGPPWGGIEGGGITASGFDLPDGPVEEMIPVVAVDPARVPRGSLLYIWPNPYRYSGAFHALDTGGAIKAARGNEVDFLIMSGRAAQERWGRKQVTVSGRPIPAAAGGSPAIATGTSSADCAETAASPDTATGPVAARVVAILRAELARGETESRPNCVSYNSCSGQPWCASFATYVWQRAGVDIPSYAFTGDVYTWARSHTTVLAADARPSPGDAVLYGTGPSGPSTSKHIGVVEQVLPDGRIVTIEGNLSDRVKRNGPFFPRDAASSGEPAAIYGYARPTAPV